MTEVYSTTDGSRPAAVYMLALMKESDRRKKKHVWKRHLLARQEQGDLSEFKRLVQELSLDDHETYREWMLLDRHQFFDILSMIRHSIDKMDTQMKAAVTAEERLAITLRYLATGEAQNSLATQFQVSQNLISSIIPDVCSAIYIALQPMYMVVPNTQEGWNTVADGFNSLWHFPNCLGGLAGRQILVQNSPVDMFMLALVDSDHKFLYVHVGPDNHTSDEGVWSKCKLSQALEENSLCVPPAVKLPFSNIQSPFVILGDDVFPLKEYLVKPYPEETSGAEERMFNYRLSRARRVSENAFGILASRFQVYKQAIRRSPTCTTRVVLATVVLHNYLSVNSRETYTPMNLLDREDLNHYKITPGYWHQNECGGLINLQAVHYNPTNAAVQVRDNLRTFFNTDGFLPWQREMAYLH